MKRLLFLLAIVLFAVGVSACSKTINLGDERDGDTDEETPKGVRIL
ncbi:MAG: hypothetical protein LBT53_02985 [Puniceicoccales bacterium]|nr:hypothetical protein [Puniceicoccales bacterium]